MYFSYVYILITGESINLLVKFTDWLFNLVTSFHKKDISNSDEIFPSSILCGKWKFIFRPFKVSVFVGSVYTCVWKSEVYHVSLKHCPLGLFSFR